MKKLGLILAGLFAFTALQAQWVDDPATNTFIANCGNDDGELYMATNPNTGDTYIQWEGFDTNGWSPTLQRISFEGVPQWGDDGIHIGGHEFSSMSEGVAMTTTADGCVVSCFANYDGFTYAVKIDPDGNFVWGEQGLQLFGGLGFSRTELTAGDDGGFWALGFDYSNLYLQYVGADGTLGPTTTISDSGGYKCMFGQLTLSLNNNVLLTYEKVGSGFYTDKELFVVAVTPDGTILNPASLLMSSQTFQSTYIHNAVADGMGGGYAYIWHPGIGGSFNTYVFHFNEFGVSTISDLNGTPVHEADANNYYLSANGTIDPVSFDLIIAYEQTDSYSQTQSRIYMNRITATGEKVWGEGILVADYVGNSYSDILVDAFEDGSGFSIIYNKGDGYNSTVEAKGFDMDGNPLWSKQMCSNSYPKYMCENSTGFHMGQNIVAWVNSSNGGVYGQNIGTNGSMGEVIIPTPCPGLENFAGEYIYNSDPQSFGVLLTWDEPEGSIDFYRLYRTDVVTNEDTVIEFGGEEASYFDVTEIGQYKYQLRAQFADVDCGLSDPASTSDGLDYIYVEVTGIEENPTDEIVTPISIYTMTGQRLNVVSLDKLSNGVYVIQGLTQDGRMTIRKVLVNK